MYLDESTFRTRQEVIETLYEKWKPNRIIENVEVSKSIGRICAEDLYSKNTLPAYRVSALDGICVSYVQYQNDFPCFLHWEQGIHFDMANTGKDFPDSFDTVIPIEYVQFQNDKITIQLEEEINLGSYVKIAGSTIKKGDLIFTENQAVTKMSLSLFGMGGYEKIPVYTKPKVIYIPTGDELIDIGEPLTRGANLETNSLMIREFIENCYADIIVTPIVKDNLKEINQTIQTAIQIADIVLVSGGSSKGNADFNSKIIMETAEWYQHGIASIPGIPVCVAIMKNTPVINLPGPHFASFCALDWCVQNLIAYYQHANNNRIKVKAILLEDIKKPLNYDFYVRILLKYDNQNYIAMPLTMSDYPVDVFQQWNAIMVIPIGENGYSKGDIVEVEIL